MPIGGFLGTERRVSLALIIRSPFFFLFLILAVNIFLSMKL